MSESLQTITLTLTDEEQSILETLARERGMAEPAAVAQALLHDALVAYYDALWDKTFAETQNVLERLAEEAHQEYLAGLTEDFDPDKDPDAP